MNDTNEMREKIEELKDILKDTNPEDRIYVIMEYIKENEKSEEFDAYFDTDINIKSYTKYENVENYISLLDNTDEQIYLAQKLCDFDLAEKLFKNYPFSKEQKEKFEKLLQNNEDLTKTLNPQILTSKYDFLDSIIDFITAERNSLSQDIILKMDDKNLEIFKILYEKIDKDTVDKLSKVWYVVRHIVYDYSELNADLYEKIKNGEKLNDDIINKLLWLYTQDTLVTAQTIEIKSRIRTLEDLNNLQSIIKETCNNKRIYIAFYLWNYT